MTSIIPNKNFSQNSSSDLREESVVNYFGIDYTIIDELNEFRKLGFNTFEEVNNLTDLIHDQETRIFASSGADLN